MELARLPLKLQAAAMISLMTAASFATIQNQTLLEAYTRHGVLASQDLARIVAEGITVRNQAILSDHLIRFGRHIQSLNKHLDAIERTILANQDHFVNGDWSNQMTELQTRLTRLGYQGKLHLPTREERQRLLASIKQRGLRNHLRLTGQAVELKGVVLVSPYARILEPYQLMNVSLRSCGFWQDVGAGWMALGAVAMLGTATAPLGTALAAAGGFMWLVATYVPALC